MNITTALRPVSSDQIYSIRKIDRSANLPEKLFKELADASSDLLQKDLEQKSDFRYNNPVYCTFVQNDPQIIDEVYSQAGDLIIPLKTGTIIDIFI